MYTNRNFSKTFLLLFSFIIFNGFSQEIIAKKGSYGVDETNKIIVWHIPDLESDTNVYNGQSYIKFDKTFKMENDTDELSYSKMYFLTQEKKEYNLYITRLPLIHLNFDTTVLNTRNKQLGQFTYYYENNLIESNMGIRQRGNLSLSFPKKSYDIQFLKDNSSKETKNLKFMDMRSDDDWILDGLYDEPLKLRSHIAARLWTDFNKPYYISKAPKAKNGFNSNFVELFRNNQYLGLYALTEQVDRKLLSLAKNEATIVHGELFKANSYKGGPAFEKAGAYNNLFPYYLGFRMEYPIIDYNSHWNNLSRLLDLVVNQSNNVFIEKIADEFYLSNAIDYFIFANLLHAGDNLGKNYYLGKYDLNELYFIIPWDLDSTFGNSQDKIKQTNTDAILTNGLFKRLLSLNPNEYKSKLKSRWKSLRDSELSNSSVIERFENYYNRFTKEKIYERNLRIWPKRNSNENDYEFLTQWLNSRMSSLDMYFEGL